MVDGTLVKWSTGYWSNGRREGVFAPALFKPELFPCCGPGIPTTTSLWDTGQMVDGILVKWSKGHWSRASPAFVARLRARGSQAPGHSIASVQQVSGGCSRAAATGASGGAPVTTCPGPCPTHAHAPARASHAMRYGTMGDPGVSI